MTERRILVIAEAGVNHNGNPDTALSLVDAAAEAGADRVKFQSFLPEALASRAAVKAPYQARRDGSGESQLDMLRRLALDRDTHYRLVQRCIIRGIGFLSSPFDQESARFLCHDLDLPTIKLGSGELTNAPLLLAIARSGKALILSTGMADLDEVAQALGVLAFGYTAAADTTPGATAFRSAFASPAGKAALRQRVTLLHCTTAYPCPPGAVNLRAMDTLAEHFGLPVGYSDHTQGVGASLAAAARGACIIEKHFTLDRNQTGPDHAASLEPAGLAALVKGVRQVERYLGRPEKRLQAAERDNVAAARKGLVAARVIHRGERFDADNLTVKRPGDGVSPMRYWDLLGTRAARDFAQDEPIDIPTCT
jgi:N-acetylneuraminate synthase